MWVGGVEEDMGWGVEEGIVWGVEEVWVGGWRRAWIGEWRRLWVGEGGVGQVEKCRSWRGWVREWNLERERRRL